MMLTLLLLTCLQSTSEPVALDPQNLDDADQLLQIFDVRKLTGHERLRALELELQELVANAEAQEQDLQSLVDRLSAQHKQVDQAAAHVLRSVTGRMEPPLGSGQSLTEVAGQGRLLLWGTQAQHAWLAEHLQMLAEFDAQVQVKTTLVYAPPGTLDKLLADRRAHVLAASRGEALLLALRAEAGTEIVSAPHMITLPFQRATLQVSRDFSYVSDYEVIKLEEGDNRILDPIIETVSDGLFLEFMGGPVSRTKFEVDISVVHSDVTEPIPTLKTQLGTPPVEVTIQLPEVQRTRLSGQFALAQDEMLVIANERPDVASAGAQQDIVLFLSAEPIREPLPVPVDVVVPYHVMTPDGAIHEMTSKGPITAAEAVSLFSSVPRELSAVSVLRVIEGQHQLLRIDVRAIFEAGDSTSNLRLESGDVVLLR